MATPVLMPKQGNSVESCIIISWQANPGDTIAEGQTLCEVETDKAVVEVVSPADGTLLELFYEAGDEVPVMTNIAVIGAPGEAVDSFRPQAAEVESPAVSAPVAAAEPSLEATNGGSPGTSQPATVAPSLETDGRPFISPRALNLATQNGLDYRALQGSGPSGRIIERDVRAALEKASAISPLAKSILAEGEFAAPAVGSGPRGRIMARDLKPQLEAGDRAGMQDGVVQVPVRGVRKLIAERMLDSLQTTAQLTLNATADARALLAFRRRLKASPEALGLQEVTINDLLLFVVSRTLPQFPEVNATFEGDVISQYSFVNLALAVDTPRGLVVPVIRRAEARTLKQIGQEARRLALASQEGKIDPDELSGGTFTVTNLGGLGIESFTPILNPPQVAILGVGNINLKPVQVGDEVEFIPHIGLSLTINHQVVDGAPGARFLQALSEGLAGLELMLAI